MFFSDPKLSVEVLCFFLILAAIPVGLIYWKTKQILLTVTVASLLAQFLVRDNFGYQTANAYNLLGIFAFTKDTWPMINIVLVVVTLAGFVFQWFRSALHE